MSGRDAGGILLVAMKLSPFPGMDPYLERRWGDVHVRLIAGISAALQPSLPPGLRAAGEQEVRVAGDDEPDDDGDSDVGRGVADQRWLPDVSVLASAGVATVLRPKASAWVVSRPPLLVRAVPPPRPIRRWVQIVDARDGNRVVTAVEVLSPFNKSAGRGNRDYRRKLRDYAAGRVSVVEVDLLRSSRDRLAVPAVGGTGPGTTYYTCVRRAGRRHDWEVYPMPLPDPLPTVAVPCRRTDADVPLDLQAVIDRVYREGGHYDIDYTAPPDPPWSAADRVWAAERTADRSA